jgi:ribosome maturation factor RimP
MVRRVAAAGARYVLEVSSPGIERPIRFLKHWERFVGQKVRVRIPGRGRATATIVSIPDQNTVVLRFGTDGEEQAIPLNEVRDATLAVDWSKLGRPLARKASKESQ